MKFWKFLAFAVAIILLGWGIYNLVIEKQDLEKQVQELNVSLKTLADENQSLVSIIDYFRNPENLLKELKSQFNYKETGEKLIIVVPSGTSTR